MSCLCGVHMCMSEGDGAGYCSIQMHRIVIGTCNSLTCNVEQVYISPPFSNGWQSQADMGVKLCATQLLFSSEFVYKSKNMWHIHYTINVFSGVWA